MLKLGVGALLVGIALVMLIAPQVENAVTQVTTKAGKIAELGAMFA